MTTSRVRGLLLAGLVLVGSAEASLAADTPRALVGQVVAVVDGDTIKVRMGDRVETVRYIGMNAPEVHHAEKGEEPGGREATEANRKLVEGETVRLELDVQERDRYGRLLAYVYLGDMMVNAEMVAQGYAQVMFNLFLNGTPLGMRECRVSIRGIPRYGRPHPRRF